ncbi:MAG: hypothetical protein ACRDKZ_05645 [Actinomycetota bacterium]
MSSPSSDEGTPEHAQRRGFLARFETWRRLMLAGAVILLVASIGQAIMKSDFPDIALIIANTAGFLLLAGGFAQRMRTRNRNKWPDRQH